MVSDLSRFTQPLLLTPAVLRATIEGRPEEWLGRTHAEDVMTPRQAVAHLVLCETDWSFVDRLQVILDPNFRPAEENNLSEQKLLESRTVAELLDDFARQRASEVARLNRLGLTDED